MSVAEITVRAVTYVAALLMFGASLFVIYASGDANGHADDDSARELAALRRKVWRLQLVCAVATVFAGLSWLVIDAATVAGVPLAQAASRAVAGEVLAATLFGRAMAWHLGIAALMTGILVAGRSAGGGARSPVRSDVLRAILAAGMLATLAWMGHAAATRGSGHYAHLGGDIVHLLAAGAWLGALPLLASVLLVAARRESPALDRIAVCATRRFSAIGLLCVSALLVTGTINAWYLVATPAALFGTTYGQLLLLKLALFASMLVLAARNRFILMPRVREADAGRVAMRDIGRNAWAEASLGIAVVVIVGALGISVPGAHSEIAWPLPFRLDPDKFAIVAAHPTTYARSTVRYATSAIASGATLYQSNCAACHGTEGRGDGPAAASLPVRPTNLASGHGVHHLPGDLYWWIAHGISGTPMPGFESRLTPEEIWQVVTFLHALADGQEAGRLGGRVEDLRPIVAPDFEFEVAGREQETLDEQRGRHAVMLVLYSYPRSGTRLAALSEARGELERAGIRVIAVPLDPQASAAAKADGVDPALLALADPSVASAYLLLTRNLHRSDSGTPESHAEFLVDRSGYVRSIRTDAGAASGDGIAGLMQDADRLRREPFRPPELHTHAH